MEHNVLNEPKENDEISERNTCAVPDAERSIALADDGADEEWDDFEEELDLGQNEDDKEDLSETLPEMEIIIRNIYIA